MKRIPNRNMNKLFASLAILVTGFALSATSLQAGDSQPEYRPVAAQPQANYSTCPSCVYDGCPFAPRPYSVCRPTPVKVYRYGSPTGPKSACTYGVSSDRDVLFYSHYPTSRGR
ncbi:MAG: hypothetical protein KDN19_14535 [Verrucomicrobiae bacterium]|nr:hypothetical protein [Verrucomicrobiae bacterium]